MRYSWNLLADGGVVSPPPPAIYQTKELILDRKMAFDSSVIELSEYVIYIYIYIYILIYVIIRFAGQYSRIKFKRSQ